MLQKLQKKINLEKKYAKINELKKKNNVNHNLKDNINEVDFSSVEWKGFCKTTKNLISLIVNFKQDLFSSELSRSCLKFI